jgi:hypothetical protein
VTSGVISCLVGTRLGTSAFADHPDCSRIFLVVHDRIELQSTNQGCYASLDGPQWAVFER